MTNKFAVALLALAATSAAMAAPPPASVSVTLTPVVDDTDPSYAFATVPTREVAAVHGFNDYYSFHLDGLSDVTFSVTSDPLYNAKGNVLLKAVTFESIKLAGPNDFLGNGSISGSGLNAKFSFEHLAAGDYTVTLLGEALGKSGGNYYGNLGVTAAVPEPESIALCLAGVGVVGALARRRKIG